MSLCYFNKKLERWIFTMKKYSTKQKLALTMAVGLLATSAPALSFADTTVEAGLREISGGPGSATVVSYTNLRNVGNLIKTARATKLPADIAAAQAAVNALNLQNPLNITEYNKIMVTIGGQVVVVVDKTTLNAAVATADAKVQATYTEASWTAFQTDYAAAKLLPETTQAEVEAKVVAINAAVAKLVVKPVIGENELTGMIEETIYGEFLVVTLKAEITAITSITVNGAPATYGNIENGEVRVAGVKAGDAVVLTAGGQTYTVKF